VRTFKDCNGKEWKLADIGVDEIESVRIQLHLDLADITGDVFTRIENDPVLLRNVLTVLCSCDPTELSKGLKRDGISRAIEAVRGAVEDFFPPNKWSDLQSNLSQRKAADDQFAAMKPALQMLNHPDFPQDVHQGVMEALRQMIQGNIGSPTSTARASVSGPLASLLSAVSDSPASLGSIPAA